MAMLTIMKGIPLAYNTDMSEDKEQVYDSMDTLQTSLKIMAPMLEKWLFFQIILAAQRQEDFQTQPIWLTTVRKGIPFREAHHIVGSAVNYCIKHRKMLEELTLDEFHTFDDKIENDIYESISLEACIKSRMSYGGTGTDAVKKQIEIAKSYLN